MLIINQKTTNNNKKEKKTHCRELSYRIIKS